MSGEIEKDREDCQVDIWAIDVLRIDVSAQRVAPRWYMASQMSPLLTKVYPRDRHVKEVGHMVGYRDLTASFAID